MGPAGLHHADARSGEMVNGAQQEVRGWDKVGVEDRDELALGGFQTLGQSTGLESCPVGAMMVGDGTSHRRVVCDQSAGYGLGFIGGIVEHLDVELLPWIFHLGNCL